MLTINIELGESADHGTEGVRGIVQEMKRILRHATPEEAMEIKEFVELRAAGCEIVDAEDGSIILYCWCRTRRAVQCLLVWIDSGRLKTVVQSFINHVTSKRLNRFVVVSNVQLKELGISLTFVVIVSSS